MTDEEKITELVGAMGYADAEVFIDLDDPDGYARAEVSTYVEGYGTKVFAAVRGSLVHYDGPKITFQLLHHVRVLAKDRAEKIQQALEGTK